MANKTKNFSAWDKIWRLALCIAVPLAVGGLSAYLTMNNMSKFGQMNQPPLAPPAWLFPIAWTILYILMGLASYFIGLKFLTGKKAEKSVAKCALILYGVQLFFNFLWSPLFFNFEWYYFAFGWLLVMWALIIALIVKSAKISHPAMWCLIPYLCWTTFAAYLNLSIAILN